MPRSVLVALAARNFSMAPGHLPSPSTYRLPGAAPARPGGPTDPGPVRRWPRQLPGLPLPSERYRRQSASGGRLRHWTSRPRRMPQWPGSPRHPPRSPGYGCAGSGAARARPRPAPGGRQPGIPVRRVAAPPGGRPPSLGFRQRRIAQQQARGAALFIPQRRLALQRAQVLREPRRVAGLDRLHEPVVHQLDPCIPAAGLGAHQEAALQGPHHAVGQAAGLGLALVHQPAVPASVISSLSNQARSCRSLTSTAAGSASAAASVSS